ncbi:MAG: hypothetical protein OXE43_12770 [Chloroflexi bacterium]|nr:hypothetical protein [Chloroflexota bacterium]
MNSAVLAVPTIAIAVSVLLGMGAAGASSAVLASDPTPTHTPIAVTLFALPDKSHHRASPVERSTELPRSEEQADTDKGTIYTWQDGDRTMRVVMQDDLVVQETAANTPEDVVVAKGIKDSIVQRQARHGPDASPVFRPESGGGLMTLPGGVLLALDQEWDDAAVESFFSRNDISTDRISELGFIVNGFLVETEPGLQSLELANAVAVQDGVLIASPNWRTETQAR